MKRSDLLAAMTALVATAETPRPVHIKGLGDVHVREITIGEIDAQLADTSDKKNQMRMARGATRLLCDERGERLLDPENDEDVALMARMPLRILTAINATQEEAEKGN